MAAWVQIDPLTRSFTIIFFVRVYASCTAGVLVRRVLRGARHCISVGLLACGLVLLPLSPPPPFRLHFPPLSGGLNNEHEGSVTPVSCSSIMREEQGNAFYILFQEARST